MTDKRYTAVFIEYGYKFCYKGIAFIVKIHYNRAKLNLKPMENKIWKN